MRKNHPCQSAALSEQSSYVSQLPAWDLTLARFQLPRSKDEPVLEVLEPKRLRFEWMGISDRVQSGLCTCGQDSLTRLIFLAKVVAEDGIFGGFYRILPGPGISTSYRSGYRTFVPHG